MANQFKVKQYVEFKDDGKVIHSLIRINEEGKNKVLFDKTEQIFTNKSILDSPSKEEIKKLSLFIDRNKKVMMQVFPDLRTMKSFDSVKIIILNEKIKTKNWKKTFKAEVLTQNIIKNDFSEWRQEIKSQEYSDYIFVGVENRSITVDNMNYELETRTLPDPASGEYEMNITASYVDKKWWQTFVLKGLSSIEKKTGSSRGNTLKKDVTLSRQKTINNKVTVLADWGYEDSYIELITGKKNIRLKIEVGLKNIVTETMKDYNVSGKFTEKVIYKYIKEVIRFGGVNQQNKNMNLIRLQDDNKKLKEIRLSEFVEKVRDNLYKTINIMKEKIKFNATGMSEESAMWLHMGKINEMKDVSYVFRTMDLRIGSNQMIGGSNYVEKVDGLYKLDLYAALVSAEEDKMLMQAKTRKELLARQNSNEERIDDVAKYQELMTQQNTNRSRASLAKTKNQILAKEKAKNKRGN